MANKLELTWYGKEQEISVEPRLLIERPELSNTDAAPDTENMLIHGDNLFALKALESKYAGQVKCIFIDPPYNTGSAFEHYDDGKEHSIWLSLMRQRLIILRNLLADDGSIYVSIDFNEVHYLKVLMDEIFGRSCFQREIIWRIGWVSGFKTVAKNFIRNHDSILYYTKNPSNFFFNKEMAYNTIDDYQKRFNDSSKKEILRKLSDLGVSKSEAMSFYDFVSVVGLPERYPLEDTWNCSVYDKLNSIAVVSFSGEKVSKMLGADELKGQKAEALIRRILNISTAPGDLVLDSFLGTGTTSAVAQKMGRKWIGIEIGEQAYSLAKPRLDKVIAGRDYSGISSVENWKGGGGYRFYELAPTLINKDEFGEYIINPDYSADMLAAAMALHEGFTYEPDSSVFWKQSHGNEKSYLFVTTRHLNAAFMDSIIGSMEDDEYLVIACCSFDKGMDKLNPHITVKKIPQMLLERCEFDKADYNLNIIHPPVYNDEEECGDEG